MTSLNRNRRVPAQAPSTGLRRINHVYSFWGKHPAFYAASDSLTFLGRPSFIRSRAVQALDLKKTSSVLELGCGTGRNLPFLRKAMGEQGKIVGFDFSRDMLEAAIALVQRKTWHNVTFIRGDASRFHLEKPFF